MKIKSSVKVNDRIKKYFAVSQFDLTEEDVLWTIKDVLSRKIYVNLKHFTLTESI